MPGRGDRHEAKQGETPKAGTQDKRTRKARKQTWFAHGVPPAPATGGEPRAKADHNSPRQSAWAECVCGRVCGRLSAFLGWLVWWFGCFFGVFGVFSCFFDIFGL